MKPGKQIYILTMILTISFFGCIHQKQKNSTESRRKISITDFKGQELNFDKPAERIVCLIESALSGFYMLGAENSIVGVSTNVYDENVVSAYSAMDERIKCKALPSPGNWDFVSIENVVALQPDVVIMWASQVESIEAIVSKGIPVYAVMLKSTNDIYKEIEDFGKFTGKEQRADSLIRYTKNELNKIEAVNEKQTREKPKVYFMWSQGPLETSGYNSMVNELIEMAGAKNVCTSPEEHLVVNIEKVIEWNPDIIVMWCDVNKNPDDIMRLSGWSGIKAVKEKRVFQLPSVFFCDLWTLKFEHAVKLLSTSCYPESDINFNLEKEKREMLYNLYGKKGENIPW